MPQHPEWRSLRFQNGVAVFPTNATANKKSIYVVTTDGQLAQVWDTTSWNLVFPAALAEQPELRFENSVAVFPIDAAANKKSIYAITTQQQLAQMSETDRWRLEYPAIDVRVPAKKTTTVPAFPLTVNGEVTWKDGVHSYTTATIHDDGRVTGQMHTWSNNEVRGVHGVSALVLCGVDGKEIYRQDLVQCGVSGKLLGEHDRTCPFDIAVPMLTLNQTKSAAIKHHTSGEGFFSYIDWEKVRDAAAKKIEEEFIKSIENLGSE